MERPVDFDVSQSVVHAFNIMEFLDGMAGGCGVSRVARELQLPRSSVFRLMKTLQYVGAVQYDEKEKLYSRRRTLRGSSLTVAPAYVTSTFMAAARRMNTELDETIQLGVFGADSVVFMAYVESSKAVRLITHVGRSLPLYASAAGKAMLAFQGPDIIDEIIARGLHPLTPYTITDAEHLKAELDAVRHRGYATEEQESTDNLSCIAVPIRDAEDNVFAAVTICLPKPHLPDNISVYQTVLWDVSNVIMGEIRARNFVAHENA